MLTATVIIASLHNKKTGQEAGPFLSPSVLDTFPGIIILPGLATFRMFKILQEVRFFGQDLRARLPFVSFRSASRTSQPVTVIRRGLTASTLGRWIVKTPALSSAEILSTAIASDTWKLLW